MADKEKYDAWICKACADQLEVLLDFKSKATFASEVYFTRTREACERMNFAKNALENTKATPAASLGVSIKQEQQCDSSEVPFVTRIPLKNVEKLSNASPNDFIQSSRVNKKRKLEEDGPEKPKQKAKLKTKKEKSKHGKVSCLLCGVFVAKSSLKRHIERIHKKDIKNKSTSEQLKCGFCNKTFDDMQEYKNHNFNSHREILQDFFKRNKAVDVMHQLENSIVGWGT